MNSCVQNHSVADIQSSDRSHYESLESESAGSTAEGISDSNDQTIGMNSIALNFMENEPKQKCRQRNPENWKQNIRKRNKNKGLEYIKVNGKVCEKKKLGPPCTCREKCYAKIGQDACQKIFENFWKLGDHSLQNAYIAGCVRIFLPKHCYKKDGLPSRRFFSRNFHVTVNGVDTEVCKQAFLNMHAISNGRLDRLLKKKQEIGNTGFDERGRHGNKVNKIPQEKIWLVRKHIDSVRQKAGFTGKRKPKKVEILSGTLNIRTMYRSYKEEMIANGLEPVCEYRYRKIFHTDFHLDFGRIPTGAMGNESFLHCHKGGGEQKVIRDQELSDRANENDKKLNSLSGVSLEGLNLNVTTLASDAAECTKATSPFVHIEISSKIDEPAQPEMTPYVPTQEVYRLDYTAGYNGTQQNWVFANPS